MFGTFSCRGGEGRVVKVRMRFLALIIMICPFGGLNSLKWPQINSLAVIAKIFRKKRKIQSIADPFESMD